MNEINAFGLSIPRECSRVAVLIVAKTDEAEHILTCSSLTSAPRKDASSRSLFSLSSPVTREPKWQPATQNSKL